MYLFLSIVYTFQSCCCLYFFQVLSLFLTIFHCSHRVTVNHSLGGFSVLLTSGTHLSSISCNIRLI